MVWLLRSGFSGAKAKGKKNSKEAAAAKEDTTLSAAAKGDHDDDNDQVRDDADESEDDDDSSSSVPPWERPGSLVTHKQRRKSEIVFFERFPESDCEDGGGSGDVGEGDGDVATTTDKKDGGKDKTTQGQQGQQQFRVKRNNQSK